MHPDHRSSIDEKLKDFVSRYEEDIVTAFSPAIKNVDGSAMTSLLIDLKAIQISGGRTRKSNTKKNKNRSGCKSKKNKTRKN